MYSHMSFQSASKVSEHRYTCGTVFQSNVHMKGTISEVYKLNLDVYTVPLAVTDFLSASQRLG